MRKLLIVSSFLLVAILAKSQSPDLTKSSLSALATWHYNFPQEKAYVQQDKPFYVLGETLWFKAYLVNAIDHSFITPSQTLYVDLLDSNGVKVDHRNIRIKDGSGEGEFLLSPQWRSGTYHLRAYTNYMLNYDEAFHFVRTFEIGDLRAATTKKPLVESDLDIRFFPEGGQMLCDVAAVVGVRAYTKAGKPQKIKAKVFNAQDELVTLFATNTAGYGKFSLTPTCGTGYRVELVDHPASSASFPVPQAQKSGYALNIKNAHKEEIYVQINSSQDRSLESCYVVGHLRGAQPWLQDALTGNSTTFILNANDLAPGVNHITLFEGSGTPVAERLLYKHANPSNISLTSDADLKTRALQELTLEIEDQLPKDVTIQGAISIYLADLGSIPDNLSAYLLLQSDLRGHIDNAMQYFPSDGGSRLKEIDLLMLTHGWRRFSWESAIAENFPKIDHLPENGFTFSGLVEPEKSRKKSKQADVSLTVIGTDFNVLSAKSDSTGKFIFRDLELTDTTGLIFRAQKTSPSSNKKNKKKNETPLGQETLALVVHTSDPKLSHENVGQSGKVDIDQALRDDYNDIVRYNKTVDENYANLWSIDLDEVVVADSKIDPDVEFHQPSMLYSEPDARVLLNEFPSAMSYTNMFDFIRGKVTGVDVIGSYPSRTIRIRGTNTILGDPNARFLLDGVSVSPEFLNNYPMERIAFIDVIKSVSRSVALGGNQSGIVAVYTKSGISGNAKVAKNDLVTLDHAGYYQASEYYVPSESEATEAYLDNRTTLYWNPKLTFSSGAEECTFYTSNQIADYLIAVQAMSSTGQVFYGEKLVRVK